MVDTDLEAAHAPDGMIPVALDLWRDGLHPVPLADGRKEPPRKFPMKRWLNSDLVEGDVIDAFRGRRNIGVALGDVSGGLTCRDFDREGDYESWRDRYPEIARCCPTSRTHRGAHCYFHTTAWEVASYCSPGSTGTVAVLPDGQGELRRGGYMVFPPSRHPEGGAYRLQIPMDDPPFVANLAEVGLVPQSLPQSSQLGPPELNNLLCPTLGTEQTIGEILARTLPRCVGERHHCLFALIRRLKAHPDTRLADPIDLKPVIEQWHRLAYRVIRTKDFGTTWREFLSGWDLCRIPAGAAIGAIAGDVRGERIEWLADLCRILQARAGDNSFFLDCRTAAALAGVGRSTISRWLRRLRADGRIEVIRAGNHVQRRASEYRYLERMDCD